MKMEAIKIWVRLRSGVAGVEQALGVGHHCPVDLEQVGKEDAQHTGDQDAQERSRIPPPSTAGQSRIPER